MEKLMKLRKIDIDKIIEVTNFYNEKYYVDGIYYSEVTGRIFEAIIKEDKVHIKYADELYPKRKTIPLKYFLIQKQIECYEDVINYTVENI
jgi:hypothetical protein